jgi:hypothetical protein
MRPAPNSTWIARLEMRASAKDVLDALTDPEVCSRWSPIDLDVFEAGPERLALRASGPLVLEVDYRLAPAGQWSTEVSASVTVEGGRGLIGRTLERATRELLAGGALQGAVARIARDVETSREAAALAS